MCVCPLVIKNPKTNKYIQVPCNKCHQCKKKLQNDWYIRMKEDSSSYNYSYFITLTYADEHLPLFVVDGVQYSSVSKSDCQLFMKRLREDIYRRTGNRRTIHYFLASEYGSEQKTARPHYHLILLSNLMLTKEDITKNWTLGFVDFDYLHSTGGFRYASKYAVKPDTQLTYKEKCGYVEKTFRLVSKGLGKSYTIDSANLSFHHRELDNDYYYTDGFKYSLPRYFKNKIYSELERNRLTIHKEYKKLKEFRFRFMRKIQLNGHYIYDVPEEHLYLANEFNVCSYSSGVGKELNEIFKQQIFYNKSKF